MPSGPCRRRSRSSGQAASAVDTLLGGALGRAHRDEESINRRSDSGAHSLGASKRGRTRFWAAPHRARPQVGRALVAVLGGGASRRKSTMPVSAGHWDGAAGGGALYQRGNSGGLVLGGQEFQGLVFEARRKWSGRFSRMLDSSCPNRAVTDTLLIRPRDVCDRITVGRFGSMRDQYVAIGFLPFDQRAFSRSDSISSTSRTSTRRSSIASGRRGYPPDGRARRRSETQGGETPMSRIGRVRGPARSVEGLGNAPPIAVRDTCARFDGSARIRRAFEPDPHRAGSTKIGWPG